MKVELRGSLAQPQLFIGSDDQSERNHLRTFLDFLRESGGRDLVLNKLELYHGSGGPEVKGMLFDLITRQEAAARKIERNRGQAVTVTTADRAPVPTKELRFSDLLLEAVALLNNWARSSGGSVYASQIYGIKNQIIARSAGSRFRTSVQVRCWSCGGTGIHRPGGYTAGTFRHFDEACWHCESGKRLLPFMVSEILCGARIIQWHTPADRAPMRREEFELLQMVSPGDWQPRQPGLELPAGVGVALLMNARLWLDRELGIGRVGL